MNKLMVVIINPGSGPCEDAKESNAIENIRHYVTDCQFEGIRVVRIPERDYGEGRFAFLLWKGERCHEIQMPGLPLNQVRFMDEEDQNIWDFPRLYLDGSSWVWKFCILSSTDDWEEWREA